MFNSSRRQSVGTALAVCALWLSATGCDTREVHAAPAVEAPDEALDPVVVTVFTDQVELFMEYPRLVPGREARFLAHVTVLATGEPVRSGQLRLEVSRGTSPPQVFERLQPERDGLFIPVATFDTPGRYDARIVVTSEQVEATIPLPEIVVHADLEEARTAAQAAATEEPADAIPFLLEQQWKIGLRMEPVGRRSLTARLQVPAEIEARHHALAVVSAPLAGRLLPPESGRLPHVGVRVEQGQVLGRIEPPLTIADEAQLAANETYHDTIEMELLIREYDLQARALGVEQALQQSEARITFAELALARIEGLRAKDLGTVAELEAAQRDVELARQEAAGSEALRASLVLFQERLEALRARTAAARETTAPDAAPQHALVAPISGEIVEAEHVEGEHVEPHGGVYRVLDSSRVWVAIHVSEFDLGQLGEAPGALMKLSAYPDRSFDLLGAMGGRVVSVGRIVDPETRTLTLRYEVPNPEGLLRPGMFADVFLETGRAVDAVAVPARAIVTDNGRPTAFVLVHGELFQKRVLELGLRDGGWIEVLSGLQAGERVVTSGAYLVKLASASPASFGAGHTH